MASCTLVRVRLQGREFSPTNVQEREVVMGFKKNKVAALVFKALHAIQFAQTISSDLTSGVGAACGACQT